MASAWLNTQLAYLAGIIDGEGCIYIGTHSSNKQSKVPYFVTTIQVVNTDMELINWIARIFGGTTSKYTRNQTPKKYRKDPYLWKATGTLLTVLCPKILPYSVIKKEQIKVMIAMRGTYAIHPSAREKTKPNGVQPLSQDLIDLRFALMHKLRSLRD